MSYRRRRFYGMLAVLLITIVTVLVHPASYQPSTPIYTPTQQKDIRTAQSLLEDIPIKGRAPKTGYERENFGSGWASQGGCDTRNIILHRDLSETIVDEQCKVMSGVLLDPYTGKEIRFVRGELTSPAVQIDHVVALSNAWQTGAQLLTVEQREAFANDPLELLAVDGPTNEQKGDGDAATWLPPNKAFRCQYVERQIRVKHKYNLWVTQPEHEAMVRVIDTCAAS